MLIKRAQCPFVFLSLLPPPPSKKKFLKLLKRPLV